MVFRRLAHPLPPSSPLPVPLLGRGGRGEDRRGGAAGAARFLRGGIYIKRGVSSRCTSGRFAGDEFFLEKFLEISGQKMAGQFTEEEVKAFVERWRPQLLYNGFRQVWIDTETGEAIDFAQIADVEELKKASARAEWQYYQKIDAARTQWVARFPDAQKEAALVQFEREMCKVDPYYLGKNWLGYTDAVFHFHYFMANTVSPDRVKPGYRGLREFARDCFKTTFMCITFSVQRIIRDPNVTILYKSNAAENAAKKVQEIKNHFISNVAFTRLFPEYKPRKVAEEGSTTSWSAPCRTRVQAENTVTATGVGSSKGSTSQHYDIIIGDDFWDEKSVTSQEKVAAVKKDMAGIEYLLASPSKGIILYVGTRFSHDDPTTSLEKMREYDCVVVSGLLSCGRSIFPESLSIEKFMDQSQEAYVFSCQVILNPTEENRGFSRSMFRYQEWSDCQRLVKEGKRSYRKVILTDAAGDDKSGSDPVAIIVVACDNEGNYNVIDYIEEQLAPSDFMDRIFAMWDRWQPDFVVRQKTLLETTIMSFMDRANAARGKAGKSMVRFHHYSLGKREKKMRITASLQPLFSHGRIIFDPNMPELHKLERALLEHPRSSNDNGPDALSLLDDPAVSAPATFHPNESKAIDMSAPGAQELEDIELSYRREEARKMFEKMKQQKGKRYV